MPAGRRSASRRIAPKNQKPVSATPTKSPPGFSETEGGQRAEIAVDERGHSSPPTNSSGPNSVSSLPIRKARDRPCRNLDLLDGGLG